MIMCVLTSIFYIFNDEGSTDGNITIAISMDLIELKAVLNIDGKGKKKKKKRREEKAHKKRERERERESKVREALDTVTVMTVPLETDIAMAGVRCLQIQAGRISMTLVALRTVVHPWLNWVSQGKNAEMVRKFNYY